MAYQPAVAAPAFAPAAYAYQAQQQQPGMLQPGQIINVNGIVVTVERYLSQGGFAHVYIVQSQTPINGTRQHVLKRMAVPDESMLREVKQEVDVMKVLRGHPNIVNFIEASSQPMGNGAYEVFILMEFCPGGGIIDMMNRRLRERLTEAEILQIFVDVCEGLACMHNLKPALLHRDLKVENILQASATSYKLCDFGSATATSTKAPSTTAELRALEYDLNRHTTLQYRAPEMVDVYLRRPVDEKSDIWALGVLLYKLCYYTTPFEEHGPLAILNVSYRTPPYPVYSTQMNNLIASMLREHGVQRPSVFDLLDAVHKMRGTQSKYRYNRVPAVNATPSSAPAPPPDASAVRQRPNIASATVPDPRREDLTQATQPRRGRPSQYSTLIPSPMPLSPIKSGPSRVTEPPRPRIPPVRMEVTRFADPSLPKASTPPVTSPPVWSPPPSISSTAVGRKSPAKFDNKFDSVFISSTLGTGKPSPSLSSLDDTSSSRLPTLPTRDRPTPPGRLNPHHRTGPTLALNNKPRDAFEGLNSGFPARAAPPTLGSQLSSVRARLDIPDGGGGVGVRSPSAPFASETAHTVTGSAAGSVATPPSSSYQVQAQPQQLTPASPRLPPRSRERDPALSPSDIPADERFPSLEEVERRFTPQPMLSRSRPVSPVRSATSGALGLQPATGHSLGSSRQTSVSPTPPIQRSQSPSRSRPLPNWRSASPQPHPNGPRARSPPVPSKDVPNGSLSLSEAGGRLTSGASARSTPVSSSTEGQAPSLPPRPSQSATNSGTRYTSVNGGASSNLSRSTGLAPSSTGRTGGMLSDASSSSTSTSTSNGLSRRQSLQAHGRPSYLRAPSSSVVPKSSPPRDWLTGDDDGVSDAAGGGSASLAPPPTKSAAAPGSPTKHERRSSRIISSPRKDSSNYTTPSSIPTTSFTSPRKSVASSKFAPSTPTGTKPAGRSNTLLSAESSGGEEGPEDATPNANARKVQTSSTTSSSTQPTRSTFLTSPSRPSAGGSAALREEVAKKPHLSRPSSSNFSSPRLLGVSATGERPPLSPTKRRSVQDIVDEMAATSPNRTPRKQTSAHDLVDLGSPSPSSATPVRTAAAARNARAAQVSNTSDRNKNVTHARAGSMNTTFTVAALNPMSTDGAVTTDSSPYTPTAPATRRPVTGGPRARPQSLFLPSSDSYLRLPTSGEPSPSGASDHGGVSPSSASDRPSAQRRLSISDMVHKFEALNTGELPSPVGYPASPTHPTNPTQQARIPSGGTYMYPKFTGTGSGVGGITKLSTGAGTKPPTTKPPTSGPFRAAPGRSPVSPVETTFSTATTGGHSSFPPSGPTGVNPAATSESMAIITPKSYQRPIATRAQSQWTGASNSGHQLPSSESALLQGQAVKDSLNIAAPTAVGRLNIIPPADFLGQGSVEPSSAAPARPAPLPSPSPERPYQGVGKLIAEWHKKSEANNNAPSSKVPGRAGLR